MTQRVEKVQKLTRQVLGELIQELKDPRIGFTTVTAVRMTPDLRSARVFVSVLGTQAEQDDTIAGLKSATPYLRAEVGHQMRLKYTPELVFEIDHGPEEAQRLETILRELHTDEEHD
ncbi:MAG: 30S ribosome-binding factor RbfA [Actinomycetota bacterium]